MEEIREIVRVEKAEERSKRRNILQDDMRNVGMVLDVRTKADMKNCAEKLTKKSEINTELLVAVKNGLLLGDHMITAFLQVNSALPSLLRLFSFNGGNARLQILAAHCVCNLALGGEKIAIRLAKMAGPYLVIHMEGMNPLLAEASLWTVGNISVWQPAFEILYDQGAFNRAITLITSPDNFVKSAATFSLIRALKNNFLLFSHEDYVKFTNQIFMVKQPDTEIFLLYSLLAHNPAAAAVMAEHELHFLAIRFLQQVDGEDVAGQLSVIRILGNLVTEPSGSIATAILQNPVFSDLIKLQLSHKTVSIVREATWLLANLINHSNDTIKSQAASMGIIFWINCSQI